MNLKSDKTNPWTTLLGGITSILIKIVLFLYVCSSLKQVIFRENSNQNDSINIRDYNEPISFDDTGFNPIIVL